MPMYASHLNVYPNTFDVQSKLIVEYARNPKDFAINSLFTISSKNTPSGKYLRIVPETQGQIPSGYNKSRKWYPGQARPVQEEAGTKHEWIDFFTERFYEDYPIANEVEENAVWDIVQSQSNVLANRMMYQRADEFYTLLQDSNSYNSANADTATNLGGGLWSAATSANRYIQKGLLQGVQNIMKSTMGVVKPQDLVLVMGPDVARKTAASGEIADYLAQNTDATKYLEGDLFKNQLANFGMPAYLYGIKVVVDPLVIERAPLGATSSKSFLAGTTTAYLIARPGTLASASGGENFSFIHCFTWKGHEMEVEVQDDPFNKRKVLSVIDWRQFKVVGKEAAQLFTSVVS